MKGLAPMLALGLTLLAPVAQAQGWIDNEQLMAENANRVERSTNAAGQLVRRLSLDSVTIECTGPEGAADCMGHDQSDYGAAGCLMMILTELQSVTRQCEAFGTLQERATLKALYDESGRFVAANAVPPQDWDIVRPAMEAAVDRAASGGDCAAAIDPNGDALQMLRGLTTPEVAQALREGFGVPRLPVVNPCL